MAKQVSKDEQDEAADLFGKIITTLKVNENGIITNPPEPNNWRYKYGNSNIAPSRQFGFAWRVSNATVAELIAEGLRNDGIMPEHGWQPNQSTHISHIVVFYR